LQLGIPLLSSFVALIAIAIAIALLSRKALEPKLVAPLTASCPSTRSVRIASNQQRKRDASPAFVATEMDFENGSFAALAVANNMPKDLLKS
jgi:hypothetical protein